MIKANVILDYSKWKNKIKNPNNYLEKKLRKLSRIPTFEKKKQEFSILLTNNRKMKNLNFKFRKKNNDFNPTYYYIIHPILRLLVFNKIKNV